MTGSALVISILLALVAVCPAQAQTAGGSNGCSDAQVLTIHGHWIAKPGGRPLNKWDCLTGGEEVILAAKEVSGEITVIYHDGDIAPATVKCPTREACRNAYAVAKKNPVKPETKWNQFLDFIFSIMKSGEPKQVPGILRGSVFPLEDSYPLSPRVVCTQGNLVKLDTRGSWSDASLVAANNQETAIMRTSEAGKWTITNGEVSRPELYALIDPSINATNGKASGLGKGLGNFGGLKTNPKPTKPDAPSALILVSPMTNCNRLQESYSLAVEFTKTWPETVSSEASRTLLTRYVEALAHDPSKAPQPPR